MHKGEKNITVEYLVACLLDYFRTPGSQQNWYQASRIALNHIARIHQRVPEYLDRRFVFYASRLKINISPEKIRIFVAECLKSAEISSDLGTNLEKTDSCKKSTLKKQMQKKLGSALKSGLDQEDSFRFVTSQMAREHKNQEKRTKLRQSTQGHPLESCLQALYDPKKKLPKEDIRSHLIKLYKNYGQKKVRSGALFGLLKKAKAFSPTNLHELLGDELFFLCKPTGFLDKASKIILIEVPTHAHLYALSYRKLEILRLLRQDKILSQARNLRFVITNSNF